MGFVPMLFHCVSAMVLEFALLAMQSVEHLDDGLWCNCTRMRSLRCTARLLSYFFRHPILPAHVGGNLNPGGLTAAAACAYCLGRSIGLYSAFTGIK